MVFGLPESITPAVNLLNIWPKKTICIDKVVPSPRKKSPEYLEISAVPSKLGTLPAAAPMFAWRAGQLRMDGISICILNYIYVFLLVMTPPLNMIDKRTLKSGTNWYCTTRLQLQVIPRDQGNMSCRLIYLHFLMFWTYLFFPLTSVKSLSYHLHVDYQNPKICFAGLHSQQHWSSSDCLS